MAKAIYTMKMELLLIGNEEVMNLNSKEIKAIRRFNNFVVTVYIQSWFTAPSCADAAFNDICLIQRLSNYQDSAINALGLKMMTRHSWYLSPELATLALFSDAVKVEEKRAMVLNITSERGSHLLKNLPEKIEDLQVSSTLFKTLRVNDDFLKLPVEEWGENPSFIEAKTLILNIPCVNDCAERGVALIEDFNTTCLDESQKQCLLQVVEKHRKAFEGCNRQDLLNI